MPAKGADREEVLFEALRTACLSRRVLLHTDGLKLSAPSSPVYSAWDHLAPLLVLGGLCLAVLVLFGLAAGIAAMTATAFAHIFGMKLWVSHRVHRRTVDLVLRNHRNWVTMWEHGGIAIERPGKPPCWAPGCDWRRYVRLFVAEKGDGAQETSVEEMFGDQA